MYSFRVLTHHQDGIVTRYMLQRSACSRGSSATTLLLVSALHPFVVGLMVMGAVITTLWLIFLVRFSILAAGRFASCRGSWRTICALKPLLRLAGGRWRRAIVFEYEVSGRVQAGDVTAARALIEKRLAQNDVSEMELNAAINALISAGAYEAALGVPLPQQIARTTIGAMNLVLCHINLAEADYNLGRWDAAEARLLGLDLAAGAFNVTRAGLLQQRAWIAAHRGRWQEALDLCDRVPVTWLPRDFHPEHYFTRVLALLGAGRLAEAQRAAFDGNQCVRRLSSERNALVIYARIAVARGDWSSAERYCRAAASHPFRTQGGEGLLLWAHVLEKLGRIEEAASARQLVRERDPESEAARSLAAMVAA